MIVYMKNVTITMDEDTARWARVEAARRGTSVSRLVGELLRERRLADSRYKTAMRRYRKREPVRLKQHGEHYPDRDALHDRDVLR